MACVEVKLGRAVAAPKGQIFFWQHSSILCPPSEFIQHLTDLYRATSNSSRTPDQLLCSRPTPPNAPSNRVTSLSRVTSKAIPTVTMTLYYSLVSFQYTPNLSHNTSPNDPASPTTTFHTSQHAFSHLRSGPSLPLIYLSC